MKKSQLAILNTEERLLIHETSKEAMAELDEDQVAALHARIRRARNKYSGKYRRRAARGVSQWWPGQVVQEESAARDKAEVFEDALARVSERLSELARESAERNSSRSDSEAARAARRARSLVPGRQRSPFRREQVPRSAGTPRTGRRAPSGAGRTPGHRARGARPSATRRTNHGGRIAVLPMPPGSE